MKNKQTAVEWLKKKCENSLDREPDDPSEKEIGYSMALKHIITLIDTEAIQMEKEQTGNWIETHWYEEIDGKNYKLYYDKNNEWK
jgi:hypothetical protein